MTSGTISSAAIPVNANAVAGQAAPTEASADERGAFAAALNRARSKDVESSSTATEAKHSGTVLSSAQSREVRGENVGEGNTRPANPHARRTTEQRDKQQQTNTSAAAQDPPGSTPVPVQTVAAPIQLPDGSSHSVLAASLTDAGVNASEAVEVSIASDRTPAESPLTISESLLTPVEDKDTCPRPQIDLSDAHTTDNPVGREAHDAVENRILNVAQVANAPITAVRQKDARAVVAQHFGIASHEAQAQTETTPAQQFKFATPDANLAPRTKDQPTQASAQSPAQGPASPATLQVNVATHAAVQAGLETNNPQNLRVDPGDTATPPNSPQQSSVKGPAVRDDEVPRHSAKPATATGNAIRSEFAAIGHKSDDPPDSPHDEPKHGSTTMSFTAVAPATPSSSANDIPASHVTQSAAAVKEPLVPDPPLTNSTAIAARAAEALRNAEMHVGWRSEQLGRIDIHAELRGHEVAAAMRVEDAAGRQWLSAELPKLVESLSRQDLRVASLNVADFANHSASSQSGSHSGTPQQQRWSAGASRNAEPIVDLAPDELIGVETAAPHGLSIHV